MRYFSPSKLNLFFRVLKKRSDGFHEIASLYQAIDCGDFLTFEPAAKDLLTCTDPMLANEENLVWKALQHIRRRIDFEPVHIHLEKNVPMQSGLGGGSADAATTLWALNKWAKHPLSIEELSSIGAQIGSDVAFFFSQGSAYCTGRGEILESVEIPPISGYLAKPQFGLPTPQVYRETKVDELKPIDPRKMLEQFICSKPHFFNDLEPAAFRIEPKLKQIKEQLQASGFDLVSMTGSGTAFFCLRNAWKTPFLESRSPFDEMPCFSTLLTDKTLASFSKTSTSSKMRSDLRESKFHRHSLGDHQPPIMDGICFIPFRSIRRNLSSWY